MIRILVAAALLVFGLAPPSTSQNVVAYSVVEDIEDVLFNVENEIIGRGLKIDNISHVGAMLDRTAHDVGATKQVFYRAEVFSFCSAKTSRQVMEIDPKNLVYCPYTIFVYTTPDKMDMTTVGYNKYPDNEMQIVEALLADIVKTALDID